MFVTIHHPGEPIGFKRQSKGLYGHLFTPTVYAEYKRDLVSAIEIQCQSALGKSCRKDRYWLTALIKRSRDVGDLDNYLKVIQDALEKSNLIWNDKQIIEYRSPCKMMVSKIPGVWFSLGLIE